ncbi:MAG: Glu/Leu/Phe/Val dehydrogenase [Ignavibacteriae bacterium]|nr:Glu/Leu/Phe/Val dehydrogenase [Ignavibacteria bacterium]MBI3364739.1 Glu/Leu/Phe/Val dehydrogenase [Ignavibacteriota bacterium]
MDIFKEIERREHEQVVFCSDKQSKFRAIIAIHNTTLGPALGGARMWMYASDQDALTDALRLSRGMTYKAAVAGLNLGGGKAVIIGDPNNDKNEALFRTYGRFVEGLAGRYITAEDVGTSVQDMEWVRMETKYVTGIDRALGGSGDPSPVTAFGVYQGMKACMKELTGSESLKAKKIAVQGAGHVASYLCEHLAKEGAKLFITDIYEEKASALAARTKAKYIHPDKIYDVDADVFCPCALGAIVNDDTLPRLKAQIIAGGANNQLKDEKKHGQMLMKKKILYAPDYAINAGGLISVANELEGYPHERALKQAEGIYDTIRRIFATAKQENIPTYEASDRLAEQRIESIGHIRNLYAGKSEFVGRLGELDHMKG